MIVGQSHPIKMVRNVYFRKQSRWPKQGLSRPRLRLCATGARRSRPGSAAPFKDSRPDTLGFMLSTLSTNGTRSSIAIQIQCPSTPTDPVYVQTGASPDTLSRL